MKANQWKGAKLLVVLILGQVFAQAQEHTLQGGEGARSRHPFEGHLEVLRGSNWGQGFYFPALVSPPTKPSVVERVGEITPTLLEKNFNPNEVVNVAGGKYARVQSLSKNQVVGSNGAGPCVGVIIFNLSAGQLKSATVFHFTATDNPYKTLQKMGPYPKGSHVAVFGGSNSSVSNATLAKVMRYLNKNASVKGEDFSKPLILDGYSNTEGLWINQRGEYLKYRNDRTSEDDQGEE